MAVLNPPLPLSAAEIERTLEPLEQASQLPGPAFTHPGVLEWERANLFRCGWVCAGHAERVSERGQYVCVEFGGESVLVVGDDDGLPRAFLNICRHRGARLVDDAAGRLRGGRALGPPRAPPRPVPTLVPTGPRCGAHAAARGGAGGRRPLLLGGAWGGRGGRGGLGSACLPCGAATPATRASPAWAVA